MLTPRLVCGSRMIGSSKMPAFSHFWKQIAALTSSAGCAFLIGASKPQPIAAPAVPAAAQAGVAQAELSTELLHETTGTPVAPEPVIVSHAKVVNLLVTAYCGCPKCCGSKARGLTASGRSVTYNGGLFVAADTKLFKFGTQLQIPDTPTASPSKSSTAAARSRDITSMSSSPPTNKPRRGASGMFKSPCSMKSPR